MAQKNRTILKSYFETGDKPTQSQFADLIDSSYNQINDDTGWETADLQNGFVFYGGNYSVPRYRKKNGVVYVEGLVKGGSAGLIFRLPQEFTPSTRLIFPVLGSNNAFRVDVEPNGNVLAVTHNFTWMSLFGITFLVDN